MMSRKHLDTDRQDTQKDINTEWARSQVEAFVDGSLRGAQRARMRDAIAADSRLAAEVECARGLRAALRDMGDHRLPDGLRARLLAIVPGGGSSWRRIAVPALGVAAAAFVAVIAFREPPPRPAPEPQLVGQPDVEQAIEDFSIAMRYLRVGAERSRDQLGDAVGLSVRLALTAGHDTLRARHSPQRNETNGG
jgi:anti-sigma factor RsiW